MTPVVQSHPGVSAGPSSRRNRSPWAGAGARRGLTLIEVAISSMVLVVVLLGFLGAVLVAYRTEEEARRRDQVRAVLQSFADDFLCKNVRDSSGAIEKFFWPSATPTGDGLGWINGDWVVSTGGSGLRLRLGGEAQAPEVVVTRTVREVQATATLGTPVLALPVYASVGRELVGEFTGTYMVGRRPHSLTIRVVRLDVFS